MFVSKRRRLFYRSIERLSLDVLVDKILPFVCFDINKYNIDNLDDFCLWGNKNGYIFMWVKYLMISVSLTKLRRIYMNLNELLGIKYITIDNVDLLSYIFRVKEFCIKTGDCKRAIMYYINHKFNTDLIISELPSYSLNVFNSIKNHNTYSITINNNIIVIKERYKSNFGDNENIFISRCTRFMKNTECFLVHKNIEYSFVDYKEFRGNFYEFTYIFTF